MSYILIYSPALSQNKINNLNDRTTKKDIKIVDDYDKKNLKILFDKFYCTIDMNDMVVLKVSNKKDFLYMCLENNNLQIALKLTKKLDVALKKLPDLMSCLVKTLIEVDSFYTCIKTVENFDTELNLKLQKQNINFEEIIRKATENIAFATNHYDAMIREAKCYPL